MEINGKTRLCGLIGNPVEHTVSPAIHNTLAQMEGHNLVYVPFHVEKGNLEAAVKGAYALNVLGMNITIPYKSEVIASLSEMDDLAQKIGAVNTLVRTEAGYKGYNTDILGLYRAMCSDGVILEGEEVILLGAGGVSRAVAFLCAQKGAKKVYLLNRSIEKAVAVAEEVNSAFGKECIIPMEVNAYKKLPAGKYLAIQGTSVGLYPDTDRAVIEDAEFYEKIHTGYDLIYKPAETKFMSLAKAAGAETYNGLKMLLYQGIIAYELWNTTVVSEEKASRIYEILKEKVMV